MSTGGYWWHATGPTASGAVNATPAPASVAGVAAVPVATKVATAKTLFEATTSLAITDIQETEVGLAWEPIVGISRYDIERNGLIIAANVADTLYRDINLIPSTTYIYRVRAKP